MPQYLTVQRTLVDGTTTIGGNAIDTSGTTKISQTVTVPTGTVNQIVTLSLDVSEVDHYFILATQDMTVRTNGTDEVQTITITGSPTGGTFPLTYDGQTATGIAYNATASAVQSALEALSNIAAGDVSCSGGPLPGTGIAVAFKQNLAATNVPQMTTSSASLTGGSSPTVSVSTTTAGVAIAETKTFYSNSPLDWKDSDGYFTTPFSTDITRLLISNASGTDGTFYFYAVSP